MSVELESKTRIDTLIAAANSKTGGVAADLTAAVQALCDGYGGGSSDDFLNLIARNTPAEFINEDIITVGGYGLCGISSTKIILENAETIGDYGLAYNGAVEIECPNVITIGLAAFDACGRVTKMDFLRVQTIGNAAFRSTGSLTAVIIRTPSVVPLTGTITFSGGAVATGTGFIYVPSSLVDSYKAATNWVTYADQIRAIEDYPEITGGAV